MEDMYPKIVEILEKGRPLVLATLVRLTGSAPRGVGTQCLILADGCLEGTIGGGILEARVQQEGQRVLEARKPLRVTFVLRGKDVAETEMICGGDAEVFLEPLFPENREVVEIFKRASLIRQEGGRGVLATLIDEKGWCKGGVPRLLMEPGGRELGAFPGFEEIAKHCAEAVPAQLRAGKPKRYTFKDKSGRPIEVFLETVVFEPMLYIFGGGHVSQKIVPLAAGVGFKVVVIDDREAFAEPGLFQGADEVRCVPFDGAFGHLDVKEDAFLVIVTRGHLHDKTVLQQCLEAKATYIGMIGSLRKIAIIYEKLVEEGAAEEDLKRVHAPIGLDIGAETPAEIAVSIVAELIKVRAGRA